MGRSRQFVPFFYNVTLVMRTDARLSPEALIGPLRRQLHNIDPELPLLLHSV